MFCEKCGKPNEDGARFCEGCGAPLEVTPVAAPAAAPVAAATAKKSGGIMEKVKAIHKKNKFILPGLAALVVVAIVVVVILNILGAQVSMKNFLEVEVSGYDGYGQLSYDFDEESFIMRALGEKNIKGYGDFDEDNYTESQITAIRNKYESRMTDAYKLMSSINIECEYPEDTTSRRLSNGDVIVFTLECNEKLAEAMGITIKNTTFEYTVTGLDEIEKFDVLENFSVTATGYDGYGQYNVTCEKTTSKKVGDITFTMEEGDNELYYEIEDGWDGYLYVYSQIDGDDYYLSNGDTVTLSVSIEEDYFIEYGIMLTGLEKEVTVTDLQEPETLDFLQYCDVQFYGLEGDGYVTVQLPQEEIVFGDYKLNPYYGEWYYKGDYIGWVYVDVSKSYDLKNGDEITLTIGGSLDSLAEHGLALSPVEKKVTVSGLGQYVTAMSQMTDTEALVAFAKEQVESYVNSDWGSAIHDTWYYGYTNQKVLEELTLYKMVLTTPKSSSYYYNNCWLVFSIKVTDSTFVEPTTRYIAIKFQNIIVSPDGVVSKPQYDDGIYGGFADYETLYANYIDMYNLNIEVQ